MRMKPEDYDKLKTYADSFSMEVLDKVFPLIEKDKLSGEVSIAGNDVTGAVWNVQVIDGNIGENIHLYLIRLQFWCLNNSFLTIEMTIFCSNNTFSRLLNLLCDILYIGLL